MSRAFLSDRDRFYIFDGDYAIRDLADDFNTDGRVRLSVQWNGGERAGAAPAADHDVLPRKAAKGGSK